MLFRYQLSLAVAAMALVAGLTSGSVHAQDKANVTGTWKYSATVNGQSRETTMKLKQEGEKVTGSVSRDGVESAISEGAVKDGAVTLTVLRERDGMKFTIKYNGKLEGDSIKGQMEMNAGGQARKMDWEAKREKS
jgi:hypothetical protein